MRLQASKTNQEQNEVLDFLSKSQSSTAFIQQYAAMPIKPLVQQYERDKPEDIQKAGFKKALDIFHQAAKRVPAYKDFLRENGIRPELIQMEEDFRQVPIITKKNYLRKYPLKDMAWDGKLSNLYMLSSSSGSTGTPFLWPRGEEQEIEGAITYELIFKQFFNVDKYATLYINCFAMGTWIAGPFVLSCAEYLARKGYPVLTITPGIDKNVMFDLYKQLAHQFDQVVISGYPPFVKDMLDSGQAHGINWKKQNIKFLFAAEGFSEKWRDYIHAKVGAKETLTTSINMYGSADAAILAHETPLTTQIRRAIANRPPRIEQLFGDTRLPTLAQYDPRLKYFEEVDQKVIFTTRAGLPLIRYDIGDNGGVYSFTGMQQALKDMNLSWVIEKLAAKRQVWRLPFVYVFGRSDLTASLYGLLVYPEHIKFGLERASLSNTITGKFYMSTEFDEHQDQYLLIRVELTSGTRPSIALKRKVQLSIIKGLESVNSEYSKLHKSIGKRAIPLIELVSNANPVYFRPGAKQKWVEKNEPTNNPPRG